MSNLTNLVRQYKQKKDNKILENIYKLINKDIEKRVELIYRKLKYYKIDKVDIKQELYIKILSIIDRYNPKEPFENYFYSCLKYWKPRLTKDDIMKFESLYKIDNETGEEKEIDITEITKETNNFNLTLEDIYRICKKESERKICKLYLINPNITEEEIGKELKMTKQNISLILNKLRKRLKKHLTK
jgi:RNA polymerase sigma factor (sigma-70 family)